MRSLKSPRVTRRALLTGTFAVLAEHALAAEASLGSQSWIDHARVRAASGSGRLRLLIPVGSDANITPIVSAYTELTGVAIDIQTVAVREVGTTLLTSRMMSNQRYDIVLPATYELPELVAARAIRPMDTIARIDGTGRDDDGALFSHGNDFNGHSYGRQTDGDVFLMFLNKAILKDHRLTDGYAGRYGTPFSVPSSWEELDRQIAFVHLNNGHPGAVLFRDRGQIEWEFWLRLHAKGVWPLSSEFDPQFDGDAGRDALSDMINVSPHIEQSRHNKSSFLAGWKAFTESGADATFGWGGTQKIFRDGGLDPGQQFLAAPVPGGLGAGTPDTLPYFNWGWSYAVTEGTPHPDLALSFVEYARSAEVSTRAIRERSGFFDPFRVEHYSDPVIGEIYGSSFLKVHRASLSNAIPDFYVANRNAYFDTLSAWLTLAIEGEVDPRTALSKAADHWRLLTSKQQKPRQAARWRQLRSSYPFAVSQKLRDTSDQPSAEEHADD